MNPKVSVIIPVYNVEKYIAQCLDSILGQTLKDIEVICVDDGSTDQSLQILQNYAAQDNRVSILHQKNQYAGVARNNGMKAATGDYIIFLDSDDFIKDDALEKLYTKAKKENADVTLCKLQLFDEDNKQFQKADWTLRKELFPRNTFSVYDIPDSIFQITNPMPGNKFYLREFIEREKINFQSLHNANDMYMTYISLVLASRITYVDEELYIYRFNAKGNLSSNRSKNPFCFLEALKAIKENLLQRNKFSLIERSFVTLSLEQYVYQIKSMQNDYTKRLIIREVIKDPVQAFSYPKEFYTKNDNSNLSVLERNKQILLWFDITHKEYGIESTKTIIQNKVSNPIVSVIVPVYNVEAYIDECLNSLRGQTLKNIEILCINDGSNDNSLVKVIKHARQDSRISVYNKDNSGLSLTRNFGLKQAKGKYVYYIDSDDILVKDTIEICVKAMQQENLQVLYFNGEPFMDEKMQDRELLNRYQHYYYRKHSYPRCTTGVALFNQMKANNEYLPSACYQMADRKYLIDSEKRFLPGIIHEDELYTFQTMLGAQRAGYISKIGYKRRIHTDSIMTNPNTFKNVYGYFKVFLGMIEAMKKISEDDLSKPLIFQHLDSMLQLAYQRYNSLSDLEKVSYCGLPLDEQILFQKLVVNQEYVVNKELLYYKQELHNIKTGYSFRIGRKITWLPRKFRGIRKCLCEHGTIYTLKRFIEHLGIDMGTGDFK